MVGEDQARSEGRDREPGIVRLGKTAEAAEKILSVDRTGLAGEFDRDESELDRGPLEGHQSLQAAHKR